MCNTLNVMGYSIYTNDLAKLVIPKDTTLVINTLNPHSYITAKKDKDFYRALQNSDILLPDGSGIVFAAKQILNKNIPKTAGSDLHHHLLCIVNEKKGRCFYMGSSATTLEKIDERLGHQFPNIKAGFYSPPYKDQFSDVDNKNIIKAINTFKPDVLFIGLTAPKQEKWLDKNIDKLDANLACCIGAVFDFYAGTVQRPSDFWVSHHLEWLPRFFKEPKRLWKRNFVSTPLFVLDAILYKLGLKNEHLLKTRFNNNN